MLWGDARRSMRPRKCGGRGAQKWCCALNSETAHRRARCPCAGDVREEHDRARHTDEHRDDQSTGLDSAFHMQNLSTHSVDRGTRVARLYGPMAGLLREIARRPGTVSHGPRGRVSRHQCVPPT
jgi:hypothetical protein